MGLEYQVLDFQMSCMLWWIILNINCLYYSILTYQNQYRHFLLQAPRVNFSLILHGPGFPKGAGLPKIRHDMSKYSQYVG